jgi:hypothetical protein
MPGLESNKHETPIRRRQLVACAAAVISFFGADTSASSKTIHHYSRPAVLNLRKAYPNLRAVDQNLHLEGANTLLPGYDPADPVAAARAVLWFEPEAGGNFKQFNTDPSTPGSDCHWDQLDWQPGTAGALEYTETSDACGPHSRQFTYKPGIKFMPKTWVSGQRWSASGISESLYYVDGEETCQGHNHWQSKLTGLEALPDGNWAVHARVREVQDWQAVPGAPANDLCPAGHNGSYVWLENFYVTNSLPVKSSDGTTTGYQPGLARSRGGDAVRSTGGTNWDVQLSSWSQQP